MLFLMTHDCGDGGDGGGGGGGLVCIRGPLEAWGYVKFVDGKWLPKHVPSDGGTDRPTLF